ncbi:MAG: alpha/beta fold hydrolase, partial [Bacteroidia bacterium]
DKLRVKLNDMVKATSKEAVVQGLKSMMNRKDHVKTLSDFNKPVLFIKGMKDNHYPELDIYHQASQCSLVQVTAIDEAGHLSMYETPLKCLEAIEEFIQFSSKF